MSAKTMHAIVLVIIGGCVIFAAYASVMVWIE